MASLKKENNVIALCNTECSRSSFILDYTNCGYRPEVKEKIGEMVTNGSGIRDTARVLKKRGQAS